MQFLQRVYVKRKICGQFKVIITLLTVNVIITSHSGMVIQKDTFCEVLYQNTKNHCLKKTIYLVDTGCDDGARFEKQLPI